MLFLSGCSICGLKVMGKANGTLVRLNYLSSIDGGTQAWPMALRPSGLRRSLEFCVDAGCGRKAAVPWAKPLRDDLVSLWNHRCDDGYG